MLQAFIYQFRFIRSHIPLQHMTDTLRSIPLKFIQIVTDWMILVAVRLSSQCFFHIFLISQIIVSFKVIKQKFLPFVCQRSNPVIPPDDFYHIYPLIQQIKTQTSGKNRIFSEDGHIILHRSLNRSVHCYRKLLFDIPHRFQIYH